MKILSKVEMKKIIGGDDNVEDIGGDDALRCKNSGSKCTKGNECCSKSCGDTISGTKYCEGA